MTSLEDFKRILEEHNIVLPPETEEIFRDLIDVQAGNILDQWLADKASSKRPV